MKTQFQTITRFKEEVINMMIGNSLDSFWYDYTKYGFSDEDFEDDVVADIEYKEIPIEPPKELVDENMG